MEYYGNILTLYNSNDTQVRTVKKIITDLGFPFELVENTFFFGTSSIKKSRDFQRALSQTALIFTFFFMMNPDGSTFKGGNIDQAKLDHVNQIFFEDF